jgi:hypothetical protein
MSLNHQKIMAQLVHVVRESMRHLSAQLSETEAGLRGLRDLPEHERAARLKQDAGRLCEVVARSAQQFQAASDAIAALTKARW